jgi:hypothetical protein
MTTLEARPPLHQLSTCLLLGHHLGQSDDTASITSALVRAFNGEREVRVLTAVGTLLRGDAIAAQAELARERLSGDADAGTLVFALIDRLAGPGDAWRRPVDQVLATSSEPALRSLAYLIEASGPT